MVLLQFLFTILSLTSFTLAEYVQPTERIVPYYPEPSLNPSPTDPTSEEYGEALFGLAAQDIKQPNQHWVALSRTHHHHVEKRDSQQELFEPSSEILFDYVDPETGKIHSYNWRHDTKYYVNLENLQSHGRLVPGRQLCVGPDASNRTILNLDFDDYPGYAAAKQLWNRKNLLFVIEDESCYEGKGTRSVYQGNKMTFNDQKLQMEIDAEHKRFGPHEPDTASEVQYHRASRDWIKKQDARPFYLTTRYRKRGDTIDDVRLPLQGRDINTLQDNPLKGNPLTGLPTNLPLTDVKDIPSKLESAATGLATSLASLGMAKVKDILKELEEATSFTWNETLPINIDVNEIQKPRIDITEEYHKVLTIRPSLTFIDSWVKVHMDINFGVSFSIVSANDFGSLGSDEYEGGVNNILSNHIKNAFVEFVNAEPIDVGLQIEVVVPAGASISCYVYIWPLSGYGSCSFGPSLANILGVWPIGDGELKDNKKKWDEKHKGQKQVFQGHKIAFDVPAMGWALWGTISASTELNMTTPGFRLTVPENSVARWQYKNGETSEDPFDGHIEWKAPHMNTNNTNGKITIGTGPKIGGSFTPELSFGARLSLPAVSFKVGTVENVDEKCDSPGPMQKALGFWADLKIGLYADLTVKHLDIETSWIKTGLPNMDGLEYVFHLWKMCIDITNTAFGQWELGKIGTGLNKNLGNTSLHVSPGGANYTQPSRENWYQGMGSEEDAPASNKPTAGTPTSSGKASSGNASAGKSSSGMASSAKVSSGNSSSGKTSSGMAASAKTSSAKATQSPHSAAPTSSAKSHASQAQKTSSPSRSKSASAGQSVVGTRVRTMINSYTTTVTQYGVLKTETWVVASPVRASPSARRSPRPSRPIYDTDSDSDTDTDSDSDSSSSDSD